ncbi:hypothetical protein P8631_14770, partial [Guyparkeria sp. 1SP6A2]|nr:hypothetical protein [Guyparkeria sp. 1SP6A2]
DQEGKALGEVVNSAFSDEQQIELLAVMNTKVAEEQISVYWQAQPVSLHALPYPIERLDPEALAAQLS